jgi:hypothetical protein
MEMDRKINLEETKATVKSIQSEVDETIQQQVRHIMTHDHETQSLQKACQETTTWHEAMEAYCYIGKFLYEGILVLHKDISMWYIVN